MNIELVIFDFDGTLGDTRRNIVMTLQATMERLGLPVASEAECAATIGIPLCDGFLTLFPELSPERADACVETYRELFEISKKTLIPALFPYVEETLRQLSQKGLRMTIASSRSSASLGDFVRETGLLNYIDYIVGAEDVTRAKPDPEPVLKTLDRFGCRPEHALVVGDMPFDIQMGARAGVRTCGVTYGNATREELAVSGADFIIDDFAELLPIVL